MKQVRVHAFGAVPVLEQGPAPAPAPGRSLVRMAAATVGHIDRTIHGGGFLRHPPLPYVPGVEASGVVLASQRFAAGQRVWLRGAGLGTAQDGTWREIIDAPDEALGLLPDAVDFATGAAFFSPCTSAWVALHQVGRLQQGETVWVTGASGAVGSMALQLAREAGAAQVTAVDPGGTGPGGPAPDLLLDTVGGPVLADALPRVKPGGRAVLVGYTAGNTLALDIAHFLQRDVTLLPLNMFRREAEGRAAVPELLARLADGRLTLHTRSFELAEAAEAMRWIAERGHRGRAVLKGACGAR